LAKKAFSLESNLIVMLCNENVRRLINHVYSYMTNGSNENYFHVFKTKLNKFILQNKIVTLLYKFT